ncbi:MAG: alpha-E domain-containing protein, partial [Verrucomicrobia bacterium]|nr:alpha-E domain-containing protein [Verrucomicrobiota bacterium]
LHKITGVERGDFQYKVEAERLSGKLLADLCYVTIDEVFQFGLHEYLDRIQLRLIEISKAIYKEFCEWLEEEQLEPAQLQEQSL